MGLVPRENCPMKTNPGSKTQSGLNNGIFFHSKLPFTTSFPLFLRQKREGWPISQLSHKDKRSEAHNFSSLDTVKGHNPKIWNIFVQFPEVGMILTHFPLYQASIFSIESHPIQFSGSLLIPISSILESCNPTCLNPSSLNNSKVCHTFHQFWFENFHKIYAPKTLQLVSRENCAFKDLCPTKMSYSTSGTGGRKASIKPLKNPHWHVHAPQLCWQQLDWMIKKSKKNWQKENVKIVESLSLTCIIYLWYNVAQQCPTNMR